MEAIYPVLAAIGAYLIGSLSFAVIVSRAMGLHDPRTYGSGNPGATNVLRSGNKTAALLTLLFDALKGFVPVVLVDQLGGRFGLGEGTAALVGLAAFLGHLWPVFFRYSSLASLVAAVFAPFYQLLIWGGGPTAIAITIISLLLIWRHGANIRKLMQGTESKIGQKAKAGAAAAAAPHAHADPHRKQHPHHREHHHPHHHHGAKR